MNKNVAFFLVIMLVISVFAVVVMTKVPRRVSDNTLSQVNMTVAMGQELSAASG